MDSESSVSIVTTRSITGGVRIELEFVCPDQSVAMIDWWMRTSANDAIVTLPKVTEYGGNTEGSADLRIMGDALAELSGMPRETPVAMELGVWFYALGKISRLVSDYKQGRTGKDDTWFDLNIYAMMARRIKQEGRWP